MKSQTPTRQNFSLIYGFYQNYNQTLAKKKWSFFSWLNYHKAILEKKKEKRNKNKGNLEKPYVAG